VRSAALDLVVNGTPGAVAGWLAGLEPVGVLALAGATYVSSSGIVARMLDDLGRLGNRETPSVLALLVLEDFAMAVFLPLVAVLVAGGTWWQALVGVAGSVTLLGAAYRVSERYGHHVGRLVWHSEPEQLMLRVLGLTLVVAALAELAHASAAVGAFLVGLTLTGEVATRTRAVLVPLRDLFAAVFFVAIGFSVDPADLVPALPAAALLAVVGVLGKLLTGWYAAGRDGVGRPGRWRAGTVLTARGEFSLIIIGLVGTAEPDVQDLVTGYVLILALVAPLLTRLPLPRPLAPPAPR
jgi:CPA2 family monovalent cation:H+ antiporter-2